MSSADNTGANTGPVIKGKRAGEKRKLDDNGTQECPLDINVNESAYLLKVPDAVFSRIATFLDFGERVKFAMALPSWRQPETHDVSKAIVGAVHITELDLGELHGLGVGKDFAPKLTDLDLQHILRSIDAANNLKDLKLLYCYGIQGHGLEPLRAPWSESFAVVRLDFTASIQQSKQPTWCNREKW